MPTTLRIVTGTVPRYSFASPERAARRHLGLLDRRRPQPVHAPAVLGDVARREDPRVARAHHVVDERRRGRPRAPPRARACTLGVMPAHTSSRSAGSARPSRSSTSLRRSSPSAAAVSAPVTMLMPEALEVALQVLRRARVELAPQQPVGALEDRGVQAELVQRVAGLEPEQPAARDQRLAAPLALGERADRERVLGACGPRTCRGRRSRRSAAPSRSSPARGSAGRSRAARRCRARPRACRGRSRTARVFSHVSIRRSSYQASGLR